MVRENNFKFSATDVKRMNYDSRYFPTLAPVMKKVGTVPTGKSGTAGHIGKSTPKLGSTLPSGGKLPTVPSVSTKSYTSSSSYKPPRSNKSTTFGIIWLPSKKRNKHKDLVYNSHKNERPGERAPSMYNFMSGDSSSQQFLKKKEEESNLLVPERSGHAPVAIAGAGAVAASDLPSEIGNANPEEKQEFIKRDKEDSKEAAGDGNDSDKKSENDYLENEKEQQSPNIKTDNDKLTDNVDSVFLRSPPPHKTRSTASTVVEEEDCGIKCLYYTLQCCDCVLM